MKRALLLLLGLTIIGSINFHEQVYAEISTKTPVQRAKIEKNCYKEIENLFWTQDRYVKNYDVDSLKKLYSDNFTNNDGFTKDVYFSLIKETWETYPDITYKTKIKSIKVNGNYAIVETQESAVAITKEEDLIPAIGELNSASNCRYHLEKLSDHWVITGEDVLDEYSTLKYGDARFIKMNLSAPAMIKSGTPYTAKLSIDLPPEQVVIASISREKIVNPAPKPDEKYRKLSEEQILERMFTSNTENLNEYNVAAIGITKAVPVSKDNVRVFMNGLAFIMTRVNVVPKNDFAKIGDTDEQ